MAIDAHRRICLKILLPLLLLLASLDTATSQVIHTQVVDGDTVHVSNCRSNRGTIHFSQSFTENFDGWVIVDFYDQIGYINGTWAFSTDADNYIDLWDGNTNGHKIIDHVNTGLRGPGSSVYDTIYSGRMTLHVHCNASSVSAAGGLNFTWWSDSLASTCDHTLYGINVCNIGASTAVVLWHSDYDSIMLDYGAGRRLYTGNGALLVGLDSSTTYTLHVNTWSDRSKPCCEYTTQFTTLNVDPPNSFDATDLESPFATCTYGPADSLYDNIGQIPGRHTIMTDVNAYDPVIPQLRTIPPGFSSSVRLGNSGVGAQGESISYFMLVDTNVYNIMLLRYAAVVQDPGHVPANQPRFAFTIYDENMMPIDPDCGAANFIASPDMGWNRSGGTMWKDWTTIGLDLTPYHGRYINVRFITRDCTAGAHFGYAYFRTDFFRKGITSPQCGANATSTLIAPEGFNYHWYTDDPRDTLSTTPVVNVTEGNTYYYCHLSYIENPECGFTMKVFSGQRFPLADFEPVIVSTDCIHFNVFFNNLSTVSNDGVTPVGTGEPCDSSWWYFGNGETSSEYCPTTSYDTSGTYFIILVSSLAHGQCQDTLITTLTLPTYVHYDEYYRACDSLTWSRTGETFYHDTSGVVDVHPAPLGCDTAFTLNLKINHSVSNVLGNDTACWSTPYTWHGHTFSDTNTEIRVDYLSDSMRTAAGCDSLVSIRVLRYPRVPISFDANADCIIKQYRLVATVDAPYLHWTSSPPDTALNGHFSDTVLILSPEVQTNYRLSADYSPTGVCPTADSITLLPVSFPTALIRTSPEYMTLDNLEFDAYDVDNTDHWRAWTIFSYSDGDIVSMSTAPSYDHIHRMVMPDIDSVTVGLTVSNGFCTDTAWSAIPLIHTTIWAPNVFTPTLAYNNVFQIIARGLKTAELNIYNRQGLLMYHSDDLEQPWDGRHNGRLCEQGAYVWHLRYVSSDLPDREQVAYGTVLIVR